MSIDRLKLKGSTDNYYVAVDTTYGFHLKWRRISAPNVKTVYDEIPGANGSLDETEELGEVFYEDRELDLGCVLPSSTWQTPYQNLCSKYHGKLVKIQFTNDANYYWTGRLFVDEYDAKAHSLSMRAIVYPYKFKVQETVVTKTVMTSDTVTLTNGRMRVVPTVTISAPVTLAWGGLSKALSSSSYPATFRIDGFELAPDSSTVVTITGAATVTITYREGAL